MDNVRHGIEIRARCLVPVSLYVCVLVCYGRDALRFNKSGHTVWLRQWNCYPVGKNAVLSAFSLSFSLCLTPTNTSSLNWKVFRYHFESVLLTDKTWIHFKRADTMPLDPSTQQGEWSLHFELIKIHKTIMLFKSREKIHFYWMVQGVWYWADASGRQQDCGNVIWTQ